jgi:hypothetical protein
VTEKSGALAPEHSALKSVSCDIERAPDQKSGCRPARDHSLFEFNRLRGKSGACAVAVPPSSNFGAGLGPKRASIPGDDWHARPPGAERSSTNCESQTRVCCVGSGKARRLQPVLTARTSGKRCASATKLASKGDLLSFLQASQARTSSSDTFKSTTDVMTTLLGHRQRAVPRTHPTPKPVATRLRIVASL